MYVRIRLAVLLLLGHLSLTVTTLAQELKPGDQCPDALLRQVINDPDSSIRLADYKGKLLILDFWSTYCKACIEAFPKMDTLQQKFEGKIQVLLVCREPREKIEQFFQVHKKLYRPSLPMVTGDTVLHGLFPHESVPHHVWISEEGKVLAITYGYNTNAVSIAQYLAKKQVHLARKREADIDWERPILASGDPILLRGLRSYAYLMPAIDSLNLSIARRKVGGSTRFNRMVFNNLSAVGLYQVAYGESGKFRFSPKNTVLEVKDPSIYTYPKEEHLMEAWNKQHRFFYDVLVPPDRAGEIYRFMQGDLYRSFGLKAQVEKRRVRSLVLVRTGKSDKIKTRGGQPSVWHRQPPQDQLWVARNQPFGVLSSRIETFLSKASPLPYVDAAGYTGNIDVALPADLFDQSDLEALRAALKKWGLDLVEKDYPTDVLVLRDR